MGEQKQDPGGFQPGDKVRIRSSSYMGARGIICAESGGQLEIQLDEGGIVSVPAKEVTNYSLAARRAWQAMPKRAGRPQLATPRKKLVSIRIDVDVWNRLGEAVELDLVPSREEAINTWLRQQLDILFNEKPLSDAAHE